MYPLLRLCRLNHEKTVGSFMQQSLGREWR